MKNNLFALIKFVSINKYFRSKQAAEAKTNSLDAFWLLEIQRKLQEESFQCGVIWKIEK